MIRNTTDYFFLSICVTRSYSVMMSRLVNNFLDELPLCIQLLSEFAKLAPLL